MLLTGNIITREMRVLLDKQINKKSLMSLSRVNYAAEGEKRQSLAVVR